MSNIEHARVGDMESTLICQPAYAELRKAINDTAAQLKPGPLGQPVADPLKEALLSHLAELHKLERMMFTTSAVIE